MRIRAHMREKTHDAWRDEMHGALSRLGRKLGFSVTMPYRQDVWLDERSTRVRVPFHFDMLWQRPRGAPIAISVAKSRDAAAALGQYAQGACQASASWRFVMLVPEERMVLRILAHDLFRSRGGTQQRKPTAAVLAPASRSAAALEAELGARLRRLL